MTPDKAYQRRRDYLEEIDPWVKMKAKIMACQPVRWTVTPGSTLPEREILWLPGSKELCDQIDECIQQIAERYRT